MFQFNIMSELSKDSMYEIILLASSSLFTLKCVCVRVLLFFLSFFGTKTFSRSNGSIFNVQGQGILQTYREKGNQMRNARILFEQQIYVIVIFDQFSLNSFLFGLNLYVSLCLVFNFHRSLFYVCTYAVMWVSDERKLSAFSLGWPNRFTISFSSFATEYQSNANRNETTKWRKDKIQMCYVLSL